MILPLIAIVVLIALPLRLLVWSRAAMISRDGAGFIRYAQALSEDPIQTIRSHDQHPLYPALVLGMHGALAPARAMWPHSAVADAVTGWELAAKLVTLLGGLGVVLAMYAFVRALFDHRTGLYAAVLTAGAAEFCQLSVDALSDMPHLVLYLLSLACATKGLRRSCDACFWMAGLLSGAAFVTRPEGAETALACALIALTVREWLWTRRVRAVAAVAIGAMLIAGPYMLITGHLIRKKPVLELVSPQAPRLADLSLSPTPLLTVRASDFPLARGSHEPSLGRAWLRINEQYIRVLRVTLIFPALAFPVLRQWRRRAALQQAQEAPGSASPQEDVITRPLGPPGWMMLVIAGVHLLILMRLMFRFGYWDLLSMRHLLVLAILTIPFAAAGLAAVVETVPPPHRIGGIALAFIAVLAPMLPWLLEPRNRQDAYLRRAGEWIRQQDGDRPTIMTTRNIVPFYANGVLVWSPPEGDARRVLEEARAKKPAWIVLDERRRLKQNANFFSDVRAALAPNEHFVPVYQTEQTNRDGTDRALVFRYAPP